jgi:hypothetical protein
MTIEIRNLEIPVVWLMLPHELTRDIIAKSKGSGFWLAECPECVQYLGAVIENV